MNTSDHFRQASLVVMTVDALPCVLGNRGTRAFISGEQRSKMRGTGEQKNFQGIGNVNFDFGKQGPEQNGLFQGHK